MIELTNNYDSQKALFNPLLIQSIIVVNTGGEITTRICFRGGSTYDVEESYEQVKQLIKEKE